MASLFCMGLARGDKLRQAGRMTDDLDRWADTLAPARLAGGTLADPPEAFALATAYRLQDRAAPALGTPAGWKVGATSSGAMAFLGISEPISGRLFGERLWRDGDQVDLGGDRDAEAEPEIAFHLAHSLAAGGNLLAAVGGMFAAAEIVRPSHPRPFALGAAFIVADNAAGLGALIGPELPLALLNDPASLAVTLSVGDATTRGTADAVLGNPLNALAWLAGAVGTIPAGSWVLTGSMAKAIAVPPGSRLRLDTGVFGTASLHCRARASP